MTTDLNGGLFGADPETVDAAPVDETPAVGDNAGLHYADVFEFVGDFLAVVYARKIGGNSGFRWCARWHHHPEAVARLTALWEAFETLRTEPGTAMSTWWNDHADPTMATLTAGDGPFRECTPQQHETLPPLPSISPTQDGATDASSRPTAP
ncbi:DUF4913 domain-containing protein [Aeromicrobium massiliense]|uniref:DUF4913 domain-containing protein n=1 Tax=Aeromicrobium massiliense TaxID=1464554 RepID=UPI000676AE0B|nr:DUF4913 domain-containing protein [Aeromicrobium massiliense]